MRRQDRTTQGIPEEGAEALHRNIGRGGPRDGSFDYYCSEPIVEKDMKGIGPFILAGIEIQKLLGLPMTTKPMASAEKISP